jgi:predicted DNA-binding protein
MKNNPTDPITQITMPVTMKLELKHQIHEIASKHYKTAACYVREAVIEKMKREGDWPW